jgi:NADPH-dependent ferric siderophore reductase
MSERLPVSTRRPVPDHMFNGRLKGSYLLDLEVVGVDEVAPHVRLIAMASSDLVGFEYAPGQDLLFEFPHGDRTLRRRYTIRRSDPAAGIADFEIEIHDGRGPATRWAAKAELGEHLEAIGPRGGISLRPTATSHLFVVDDSAMPAAFALLEALPADTPATALLMTSHGAKSRPGPTGPPATSIVWLDRAEMLERLSDRPARRRRHRRLPPRRTPLRPHSRGTPRRRRSRSRCRGVQGLLATGPTQLQPRRAIIQLNWTPVERVGGLCHQPQGATDDRSTPPRKPANRDSSVACEQSGVPIRQCHWYPGFLAGPGACLLPR